MPDRNRELSRRRALELGAGALAAATFPRRSSRRHGRRERLLLRRAT
jgi:hypothetical protein